MAQSVRINLSVPPAVDVVLEELSKLTSRSKSSLVMEAVGYQLPPWRRFLERVKSGQIALSRDERKEMERREIPPLSRQQRRAVERAQLRAAQKAKS